MSLPLAAVSALFPIRGEGFTLALGAPLRADSAGFAADLELTVTTDAGEQRRRFTGVLVPAAAVAEADALDTITAWAASYAEFPPHWVDDLAELDPFASLPWAPEADSAFEKDFDRWRADVQPETTDDDLRREQALGVAQARLPAVREWFRGIYAATLPDSAAVAWAWWRSLTPLERRCSGIRLAGPLARFEDDALAHRADHDPREEDREISDPAEFIPVFAHDASGLRWGLWFDDPSDPAAFTAAIYADDPAVTSIDPTPLGALRGWVESALADLGAATDDGGARARLELRLVAESLDAFADFDAEHAAPVRPRDAILGGPAPRVPPDHGAVPARGDLAAIRDVYAHHPAIVDRWIREAEHALGYDEPLFALTLGREIRYLDLRGSIGQAGQELLVRAYRLLGREALAQIAQLGRPAAGAGGHHHAH